MKDSIRAKLDVLRERYEELSRLVSDPEVMNDQSRFRAYSIELADISSVVDSYENYQRIEREIDAAQTIIDEGDEELREMAREELSELQQARDAEYETLQRLLLPIDPDDDRNVFLEIRAGTGGDEAALFAGDLFRMYSIFAEHQGWKVEVLSKSEGEHGGYKEIISRLAGKGVYSKLKFESGAHRVQRVPETEAQGRIHTSACTVAVLPEADEIGDHIDINPAELRVDTFRASGAGGQHVNKTDSAIRITHLPTGMVVECQDERSQHKNRARAMAILKSRLLDAERAQQRSEQAETRRNLVGSGDRSERIRTYNFPQGRVTDHRINLTLYKLDDVISGELEQVIEPLIAEHQADQLATLSEES